MLRKLKKIKWCQRVKKSSHRLVMKVPKWPQKFKNYFENHRTLMTTEWTTEWTTEHPLL